LIAKIEVFWIWLGDLVEISAWVLLALLFFTALFMIGYTFSDFSKNLNTRKVMEDGPPWKKKEKLSESDKKAIEKYTNTKWGV